MDSRNYKLLPLAELCREIGVPYSLLYRMVQSGAIAAHAKAGLQLLFDPQRLPELLAPLRDHVTANRWLLIRLRLMRLHRRSFRLAPDVREGPAVVARDRHNAQLERLMTPPPVGASLAAGQG